jgi:hypothetical protein
MSNLLKLLEHISYRRKKFPLLLRGRHKKSASRHDNPALKRHWWCETTKNTLEYE